MADTAGSGHNLIPPVEFIDQILIPRDRRVWIRKLATVRRLLKSTDGYQPTIETNPDDADWTSEVATAVNDDGTGPNANGGLTTGKRELKPQHLDQVDQGLDQGVAGPCPRWPDWSRTAWATSSA